MWSVSGKTGCLMTLDPANLSLLSCRIKEGAWNEGRALNSNQIVH
jgi:hypothetical protein